jgi:hypothetical protein
MVKALATHRTKMPVSLPSPDRDLPRMFSEPETESENRAVERPGQSGEAYKVLFQDRRRAVGYVCSSICTFVEE